MRHPVLAAAVILLACGCREEKSICSVPFDPKVRYVAESDKDPRVCERIRFACEPGEQPFSSECGCGCIMP